MIGIVFLALVAMVLLAVLCAPIVAALTVLARGRAQRRAEHHRLAVDADRQHAALLGGQLSYGTFGRFAPDPEVYR